MDCQDCRTNKNIFGVRYLSLDDNEYSLCVKHFNQSEQLRVKVFLKIRSLLTNVNELDWDSEMVPTHTICYLDLSHAFRNAFLRLFLAVSIFINVCKKLPGSALVKTAAGSIA